MHIHSPTYVPHTSQSHPRFDKSTLLKSTMMQFIHLPPPSPPRYSPHTPNIRSPNVRAQDYLPYKPLVKLIALYILILMFLDIKGEYMGFRTEW